MAIKPIELLIKVRDEASSMLGSVQAKVAAVAAAVGTFFGITLFAGAVKSAAEFEVSLSRVKAATGATAEEMAALKQAAEDAGANTKYTSAEAAEALENLAKAGLSAKDAVAALPAVLSLAQAGGVDLGQAAEFITKAVMGMGLAFTDAGRVADVLAMGANASNTSVTGLAQALSYTAPIAHSLGLSLETTVAIIGKFADAGIDASRAGTALNSVLSQFADPSSKFRDALNSIGITTNNFEQALRQLAEAGPKGAAAILAVGQEAGPALRALLNQGIGALDDLKGKLKQSAGSAAETAAIMEDNLKGAMNGLASAWDTVRNVLGTPVLPVLKDAVIEFAGAVKGFVADGTVAKFGEAIAQAFRSGIQWGREFLAQINFKVMATSVQDFASRAGEAFAEVGKYASIAGDTVKLAYGVMSAGANTVLAGIYGIGLAFAETAARIVSAGAAMSEAYAKIAIGSAKQKLLDDAAQMREALVGLQGVSEEFGRRINASMEAAAAGAQLARDGYWGLATAGDKVAEANGKVGESSKTTAASVEAAGKAAETSGQKQTKAATDAAVATGKQADQVKALRAEYEKQIALGNWQAAAEVMQKIDQAQRSVAASAAQSSKQLEAQATAMAAKNKIVEAGLNLELAQERAYEATAKAAGNELAVVQSKIRQKEIEIKIVQATAKAMNDEADAAIAVAKAKLKELADNKETNPELEAELRNRIELAKARKLEAQAAETRTAQLQAEITMLRNGTQARREVVSQLQSEIGAQEKLNELKERELQIYLKKWQIDKERFSLTASGDRVQGLQETSTSIYNKAKSAGLDEETAVRLASELMEDRGQGWTGNPELVNRAIQDEVLKQAQRKANEERDKNLKPGQTRSDGSIVQGPAAAPPPSGSAPAPAPAPAPASAGGASYISNVTIDGITKPPIRYADAESQTNGDSLLRQIAQARGAAAR